MSLKQAVEEFAKGIQDLSSLEVTTYTGSLEEAIDGKSGQIDWSKFTPTSGKLVLVAATQIKADFDTVNFRAQAAGITDIDSLLELHRGAVESAQTGRLALLRMFEGLLDKG
jgi:hypothetical protein